VLNKENLLIIIKVNLRINKRVKRAQVFELIRNIYNSIKGLQIIKE
jgi:hypothetical protein